MILRCKTKAANYAIYHELNNRIEHKLRISVYVFDKEGCIYPDKTASKTPLNITLVVKQVNLAQLEVTQQ